MPKRPHSQTACEGFVCSGCWNNFSDTIEAMKPRMAPQCGHSHCLECFEGRRRGSQATPKTTSCPTCRRSTETLPKDFVINHSLIEVLKEMDGAKDRQNLMCPKHLHKEAIFYCSTSNCSGYKDVGCEECKILFHNHHEVENLEEKIEFNSAELKNCHEKLQEKKSALIKHLQDVCDSVESFGSDTVEHHKQLIKEHFREKEKRALVEYNSFVFCEKRNLETQKKDIKLEIERIDTLDKKLMKKWIQKVDLHEPDLIDKARENLGKGINENKTFFKLEDYTFQPDMSNRPSRPVKFNTSMLPIDQLHALLVPLKLSKAELEKEAYPLVQSIHLVVKIAETQYTQNKKMFLKDRDLERTCSRCNKEFRLQPDGSVVREKDICRYHNGGVANNGKRDTPRELYNCCNEEYNKAPGCKFSDVHVSDQLFERELTHFVPTIPPVGRKDSRSVKAYAIKCEVVYTVSGPALARLLLVDMQGKMVLDVFVKPPNEILDPNTEYSGLTMEQVQNAQDTRKSCHAKLFKFINSKTILIGHSLESDLKALRLVHKNVIDTAVLFKSLGDSKIALKNLSARFLNRTIQGDNKNANGHDSLENARTCVDLIHYGLKNPESLVFRKQS